LALFFKDTPASVLPLQPDGGSITAFAVFSFKEIVNMRIVRSLSIVILLLFISNAVFSKVFYSKNEALALAFGQDADVEMLALFPDEKQVKKIEQLARVKLESPFFTFYVGKHGDKVLGYAAIENHIVRSKPETLMVVLDTKGRVRAVYTLAFHEPPEYQPPQRWYELLYSKALNQLRLNRDIQGIAGATLSTRSAINVTRKVMAVFQVMVQEGE
jgi:hypothetical protein